MMLTTYESTSTMEPPHTPTFLMVPPCGGGGYLLQSGNNNDDFEEEEDFNRERYNYAYIYEGEIL